MCFASRLFCWLFYPISCTILGISRKRVVPLFLLITNKLKSRKLKFGRNIRINESVMFANFGDPRSRGRELTPKKTLA